ncbi:hypothetical protein GQ53DRAFT_208798 [Thozetella sp. PMI_491]|nr:hypothetical protein GQ53DRAFT_208798 [Thozetella sp. PMI_491]
MPYRSPTDQPDRIDSSGSPPATLDEHAAHIHTMDLLSRGSHSTQSTANILEQQDLPPPIHRIVRRKSGEVVPPVLRPPARPHPSSAPPTPTSKAVRFDDSQLEEVRHFFRLDQPVSIGSPPETPIPEMLAPELAPVSGWRKRTSSSRPRNRDLTITLANFPDDDDARRAKLVRLERVALSADRLMLVGSVAVANLAYSKTVACRFTFDNWETVSEVLANHSPEARTRHTPVGYDCFLFTIDLTARASLVSKALCCCIRYSVGGCEYWDNNNNANFAVLFKRSPEPRRNSWSSMAQETPQRVNPGGWLAPSPDGIAQPNQPASRVPDGGRSSAIEQRFDMSTH